jgi:hypothetical protein
LKRPDRQDGEEFEKKERCFDGKATSGQETQGRDG